MYWLLQAPIIIGDQTTSPEFVTNLFFSFLKVLFIIAGLLYVAFAIVVVRQIYTMHETLVTSLEGVLKLLGYIHLVLSIAVLAYFILVL